MRDKYVFPDIHGCIHTLQYTFEKIICPKKTDELYFVGDFINKGPDSKGVLDYIFELIRSGYHIQSVRGNHEQLLLNAIEDPESTDDFIIRGGLETLESFKVKKADDIPDRYIQYMSTMPYYIELDDYFIVHAGFNFSSPDPFQDTDSMLTIRDYPVDAEILKYKKIIHGHYARSLEEILYNLMERNGYALDIDNGCVYTHREGMGNMLVLNLKDLSYHIQPCLDTHDYENSASKRRHYQDRS